MDAVHGLEGAPGGQAGLSFRELLESLSAVHERQQETIRRLGEENAFLRKRLELCEGPAEGASGGARLGDLRNVQPELPRDTAGEVLEEPQEPLLEVMTSSEVTESQASEGGILVTQQLSHSSQRSAVVWPIPELWPQWANGRGDSLQRIMKRSSSQSKLCVVEDTTGQAMHLANRCHQRIILRPNSVLRLSWDFLSSLMVCYDVMAIPLMVVSLERDNLLGGGTGDFTATMDFVTTSFWTLDIPWSFMTGFHSEGVVEMRAGKIARHYIKTWFSFDASIIVIDWLVLYAIQLERTASVLGLFRVGKTARMTRILRAVRLLRFVKLQRVLAECLEMIDSETIRAMFNVSMAVAFIFMINHYLACGWFFVGHVGWHIGAPNWILSNGVDLKNSTTYAYFTSLHWSLTQFTPASMEIRPYNIAERVYSIACLMFALITFSSFLASITASITQLRKHTTEAGKQQFVLRAYFKKNNVSSALSKTIWKFLRQRHFNHQTRGNKAQVGLLKLLPPNLQGALHQELYGPYITRAPFFFHYMALCTEGLVEVCSQAISEKTMVWGETLFFEGKVAEQMHFIASGYMRYEHSLEQYNELLGTGSWIAEPVLWVKWVHVAPLNADTSAELIELDSEKFRATVSLYTHTFPYVKAYAQLFQRYLQKVGGENLSDLLTDVQMLEALTRDAWCEVAAPRDQPLFQEMPHREFPRLSRSRRRWTWRRRSSLMGPE